jgi:hypothetical protein
VSFLFYINTFTNNLASFDMKGGDSIVGKRKALDVIEDEIDGELEEADEFADTYPTELYCPYMEDGMQFLQILWAPPKSVTDVTAEFINPRILKLSFPWPSDMFNLETMHKKEFDKAQQANAPCYFSKLPQQQAIYSALNALGCERGLAPISTKYLRLPFPCVKDSLKLQLSDTDGVSIITMQGAPTKYSTVIQRKFKMY